MTQERPSLERLLDQYSVAPADAELRARILAAAPGPAVGINFLQAWLTAMREDVFGWTPALPALGLALMLGVAAGLLTEADEASDLIQMAAFQQDVEEE